MPGGDGGAISEALTKAPSAGVLDEAQEKERKAALSQLCQANGIKDEDLQRPELVTHIEMVLDDYCCMQTLQYFANLRSVCLIQQAISKIEGVEHCPNMEKLLLNENRIECVEGLGNCTRLKQLYLCTNVIREIGSGLVGLQQLEVLWLAENHLTSLSGLEATPALAELNAARNRIHSVIGAFENNPNLRNINLADNRICSFREILDLARLRSLRELSFADPDWGENPICVLCNYRTYTLYHLLSLQVHDRMRINDDEHLEAQAAFSKKRLYYNMQIKLLKRHAADGLRAAKTLDTERNTILAHELESTARVLKRIDASAQVATHNAEGLQPMYPDAATGLDRRLVEAQLHERNAELAEAAVVYEKLCQSVQAQCEARIRGLMLELQTGGNVRLETGVAERDSWVRNIEELVRSRFDAEEYRQFGISDIKVVQVTRIHNRSLRIRLEEEVDRLDMHRQLEYLFHVPDPKSSLADIQSLWEEGIESRPSSVPPGPGGANDHGGCGDSQSEDQPQPLTCAEETAASALPVYLTNSISLIETPRLVYDASTPTAHAVARAVQRARRHLSAQDSKTTPRMSWITDQPLSRGNAVVCGGTLLVCAAYLCNPQPDTPAQFDSTPGEDVRTAWMQDDQQRKRASPTDTDSTTGDSKAAFEKPAAPPCALYRCRKGDPKQKVWQVSQPELVMPEYIIQFDYVYASEFIQSQIEPRQSGYSCFSGLIRDYTFYTKLGMGEQVPNPAYANLPALPTLDKLDFARIAKPENLIVTTQDPNLFGSLQVLNLHGRGIRRIENGALQPLTSLHTMLLSFNSIESVSSVQGGLRVTHLDMSFNFIEKVNSLAYFPSLQHLDMSWNSLLSLEVLFVLARDASKLQHLHLAGNPLAKNHKYRVTALAKMSSLSNLDGCTILPSEAAEARRIDAQQGELTEAVLMEHSYTSAIGHGPADELQPRAAVSPALDRTNYCQRISSLLASPRAAASVGSGGGRIGGPTQANWRGYVESVDLGNIGLTALGDLTGLTHVRCMDLNGNQLASLEGLAPCPRLEELSVERNSLTSLKGALHLPELRRLDAGSNQIADVLEVQNLTKLVQLSLEDNYIDSLDTFSMLQNIMELYLSNNLIEELRAILLLKNLPKLVVLDLSGNELCNSSDYRRYTIFHLRQLKVLDGIAVSQQEQHEADDLLHGKITLELLEDKFGPSPSCYNFRSVDLANQNLRELGQLLNDDIFPSLRELSLDGNPFNDIKNVGPLSKLLVLRMNRTKIDLEKGMLGSATSCGGIASMPRLQVLELGYNNINDISIFAQFDLQALRILHLPGNDITRVEGLSHLDQLRELVLDRNKVKQFDEKSFDGLRSLRELRVEDNGLKSLTNLGPLPRLRALHLAANRVADLAELEKLQGLRHILLICLSQNPVARKPLYRAHLIHNVSSVRVIDGKEVTEDEREKVEQMLQAISSNSQVGHPMYIFNEAQPAAVGSAIIANVGGAQGWAPGAGQSIVDSLNAGQRLVQAGEASTRVTSSSQLTQAIVTMGQGGVGGLPPRRVVAQVTQSRDQGGGDGNSKKPHPSRSHSLPRHVGLEYRPTAMPPSTSR